MNTKTSSWQASKKAEEIVAAVNPKGIFIERKVKDLFNTADDKDYTNYWIAFKDINGSSVAIGMQLDI